MSSKTTVVLVIFLSLKTQQWRTCFTKECLKKERSSKEKLSNKLKNKMGIVASSSSLHVLCGCDKSEVE